MTDSSPSVPMLEADDELAMLMALAEEEAEGTRGGKGERMACGELDDQALGRRTESILRRRQSEEDMDAVSEQYAPAGAAMDPPVRFVRKPRSMPAGPRDEQEQRSLVVSCVYPSPRAVTPQARTVRWSRKRKLGSEGQWDTAARPARRGGRGRLDRDKAKAMAGCVAYI